MAEKQKLQDEADNTKRKVTCTECVVHNHVSLMTLFFFGAD
jgi:hypothetical protein